MRNPSSTAFRACSALSVRSSNRTKSTALTASIRSRGRALSASHTSYMQFFPRESVQSWRGLASHFRPPSERSRTGGCCPEWARGKMWVFLLDHQSHRKAFGFTETIQTSVKTRLFKIAHFLSRLFTPHHRRAAINFRLGVLRPPDNICDFMSMYLSNSGQTTVINIAQKFIWLPCKFAFSRKWRPRYGPEPRNFRLANNR